MSDHTGTESTSGDDRRRRRLRAQVPTEFLRELDAQDLSLDDIAQRIAEITGGDPPARGTVSRWLKSINTPRRYTSHGKLIPWDINPEHNESRWRHMLQAVSRMLEIGFEKLSDVDQRYVDMFFDYTDPGFGRKKMVVGYREDIGFFLVDAEERDGDGFIRRENDGCAKTG